MKLAVYCEGELDDDGHAGDLKYVDIMYVSSVRQSFHQYVSIR